jgi:hypothetical protein
MILANFCLPILCGHTEVRVLKGDVMRDALIGLWLMGGAVVVAGATFPLPSIQKEKWWTIFFRPNALYGGAAFVYYVGVLMLHSAWIAIGSQYSNFSYAVTTVLIGCVGTLFSSWVWYSLFWVFDWLARRYSEATTAE